MIENSCLVLLSEGPLGLSVATIAYYSHLVPVALALFLGIYALIKTGLAKLSVIFFFFTFSFSLWLVGDLVLWTSTNYNNIFFFWSWLDYLNVVFFALGAYFFGMFTREGISFWEKLTFLALCIPAFFWTVMGSSVTEFYQPFCEVLENSSLTNYKLLAEVIFVGFMLFSFIITWKKSNKSKRISSSVVFLAILAFFAVFSFTEYIATITNVYEINLYGLFILPIFLISMVFAVTNLHVFEIRFLGTQLLVYVLIIMIGSQFLFLQSTTDAALNGITLAIAIVFGLLLLQNSKRELASKIKIEQLAEQLKGLVHFVSHEVKGALGKNRAVYNEILEKTFGPVNSEMENMVAHADLDTEKAIDMIMSILRSTDIKKGNISYDMKPFNLKTSVLETINYLKPDAERRGLTLEADIFENADFTIMGDEKQLAEHVIRNLVDNSIRYTLKGKVVVGLSKKNGKILFSVKDTGIGITKEDMTHLFTEGGKGRESTKVNVSSTGYGLFIAKGIVDAHKGRIWAESEGSGKGSQFYVEFYAIK